MHFTDSGLAYSSKAKQAWSLGDRERFCSFFFSFFFYNRNSILH